MAILQLENGTVYNEYSDIARELAPLNIQIDRRSVGDDSSLRLLLNQASLNEEEKEQVLKAVDRYFEELKNQAGYRSRDLIALHPNTPNLDTMMAKFDKIHTHADDEVRYILDGEAVFGFVLPDSSQVRLTIQPEEYINVPAGTEHWFYLTSLRRVKAVRYFIGTEGWVPDSQTFFSRSFRTNNSANVYQRVNLAARSTANFGVNSIGKISGNFGIYQREIDPSRISGIAWGSSLLSARHHIESIEFIFRYMVSARTVRIDFC